MLGIWTFVPLGFLRRVSIPGIGHASVARQPANAAAANAP